MLRRFENLSFSLLVINFNHIGDQFILYMYREILVFLGMYIVALLVGMMVLAVFKKSHLRHIQWDKLRMVHIHGK